MNRLADLLIELNSHRLPNDYIENQVELFIHDLRIDLGQEQVFHTAQSEMESASSPVFCICSREDRSVCKYRDSCIPMSDLEE